MDLEAAIRFANKASSISVTRMGAQLSMPYLEEMK
jgi:ribokinase